MKKWNVLESGLNKNVGLSKKVTDSDRMKKWQSKKVGRVKKWVIWKRVKSCLNEKVAEWNSWPSEKVGWVKKWVDYKISKITMITEITRITKITNIINRFFVV